MLSKVVLGKLAESWFGNFSFCPGLGLGSPRVCVFFMVMSVDGFFFFLLEGQLICFQILRLRKTLPITSSSAMAGWFMFYSLGMKSFENNSLISWLLINRWTLSITKTKDGQNLDISYRGVSWHECMTHALNVPLKSMTIVITSQCLQQFPMNSKMSFRVEDSAQI